MISVIIPTRNRAELLRACLESLRRQRLSAKQFEVVVVDNGSTDDTAQIVQSFSADLNLVACHEPEPGLHRGRHAGLRAATHELLVFADDDIVATDTWLETLCTVFEDHEVAMAGGNNFPRFEAPPPAWLETWWDQPQAHGRALGYLSIIDFGTGRFDIDPRFVWGCNFGVRKEVVLQAGGFHPDAFPREQVELRGDGETWVSDWVRQSGLRTVFDSGASVHHLVSRQRMSPDYFAWRNYQNGVTASYQQLRRSGGQPARPGVPAPVRRLARAGARQIKALMRGEFGPPQREILRIKRRMDSAFSAGFRFHQRRCREDPGLLEWVLRDSYL